MAVIYGIVNKSIYNQTFINNSVNVISNVAHQIIVCRRNFPYSPFNIEDFIERNKTMV